MTALMVAAKNNQTEVAKLLIEKRADLDTQDKWDICLMLKIWDDCSYGCC